MFFRIITISLLLLSPTCVFAQGKLKRPNIVFIFTDDQRADTIAALGNQHIKTPNLDQLVARGTAFRRAYCMGAMQGAVCVPSRAMVLSGRTLFKVNDTLKNISTWPAMFARAGYLTFVTGKWHNQQASALAAFMTGRTIFFGGMGDPYTLPVADISPRRTITAKKLSGKHSVELFTDSAVDFIKQQKGAKQPFVAYVAYNGPHDPRKAPKEYHARYNKDKPPLPPNFLPQHPFNNGDLTLRDERLAPWPRTPAVVRQHLADYYAYITFVDAQVGRIVAALREAGIEDDTIIVFAGDHGLAIGSHGLFGKQNLYDHSMRTPMIFAGPGIPRGKTSDAFCYLLDIFPTLGQLAGVSGPKGSDGMSLAPVMKGEVKQVRDSIFLAYRHVQRAVREDRWKIIVYPQINKTQLFDLQNDPHEIKDLAADPAHKKTILRLTDKLKAWQLRLGDKQPLQSETPFPEAFDFKNVPPEKKKKKKKGSPGVSAANPWDRGALDPGGSLRSPPGLLRREASLPFARMLAKPLHDDHHAIGVFIAVEQTRLATKNGVDLFAHLFL
jgi:arylsulfatase A-like enzyme